MVEGVMMQHGITLGWVFIGVRRMNRAKACYAEIYVLAVSCETTCLTIGKEDANRTSLGQLRADICAGPNTIDIAEVRRGRSRSSSPTETAVPKDRDIDVFGKACD